MTNYSYQSFYLPIVYKIKTNSTRQVNIFGQSQSNIQQTCSQLCRRYITYQLLFTTNNVKQLFTIKFDNTIDNS